MLYMPARKKTKEEQPTKMGERILELMGMFQIKNRAEFAEQVIGISRQRFQNWLYVEMRDVEAKPLLLLAEVLGTNPEYILGVSDDPRVQAALTWEEARLVEAFRDMNDTDKDRILKQAADWVGQSSKPPSNSAPFRHAPIERIIRHPAAPPANSPLNEDK